MDETTMGRYENKVTKIMLTADKTPGIEEIQPKAYSVHFRHFNINNGDFGFNLQRQLKAFPARLRLPAVLMSKF